MLQEIFGFFSLKTSRDKTIFAVMAALLTAVIMAAIWYFVGNTGESTKESLTRGLSDFRFGSRGSNPPPGYNPAPWTSTQGSSLEIFREANPLPEPPKAPEPEQEPQPEPEREPVSVPEKKKPEKTVIPKMQPVKPFGSLAPGGSGLPQGSSMPEIPVLLEKARQAAGQ